jgi:signal transduction histidine kinase
MAQGDLTARARIDRADEIGALAASFNSMAGQVEATVQTLRAFIADAAHELHTPLTALATDLDLAASETDVARAQAFVVRARAQTERLAELCNDLLDLSRLETGAQLGDSDLDLTALVSELGEAYASRAEQADVAFALDVPADAVRARGNAGHLRRAVGNLLDNALKFTPAGGEVSLALRPTATEVEISVRDTGIGIPAEEIPMLFQRFHRARNAAGYAGSGLGLAIAHAIVTQHRGTLAVASGPDGTVVTMRWRR